MPELPEVETVKSEIARFLGNAKILDMKIYNRSLREKISEGVETKIVGNDIVKYERCGKYIVMNLSNNYSIVWHLGMSGRIKLYQDKNFESVKHDHIIMQTDKGVLVYNDPRRFGMFDYVKTDNLNKTKYFQKMGIDPFDKNFDADFLFAHFSKKKVPVKVALLDQSIVNGIGNIYASEILYDAKISPLRSASDIKIGECEKIVVSTRKILNKAIENGGSTLRDYHKTDGSVGHFQNLHCVYNKTGQKCPKCKCDVLNGGGIKKIVQAGRSTFYCETLQK
ncbi:MAG: bifunctional DNA-formamidopyrimidine glycosylase/DNA-(apurinic or apyrimidinic site) lyase [Alphaproteobacteria bacterium]|nr:bifunctional DNA-formamidopyrimidine glycosylase/DNA-(apurinic or apyrimidinic site) lyase [Alphaproteobacteria bacterium]